MNDNYFALERKQNAIRNTKWGIVEKILILLFPFVIRTCLIYKMGIDYAGLNSLFSAILSVLNIAELGISSAIIYNMYLPIAQKDKAKICALLRVYKTAYLFIGTIILVFGLLLMPFIKFFVKGAIPNDVNLYIIYFVFLFNTVVGYLFFSYKNCILTSYQRIDIISKVSFVINTIIYILQIVIILCIDNYYLYVMTLPFATILINIVNYIVVTKLFPDYKPIGKIDDITKRELKKNILGLLIGKIGSSSRNTLDSIIISTFLGLASVGIYNNYYFIITVLNGFLGIISTSIVSGVGNKIIIESPETNYLDFRRLNFYYMWISGWCLICLLNLYQPFIRIWVGESSLLPNVSMFLFCYYFLMLKQGDINSIYYQAAGLWYYGRWRSIVEAVINLILNIILGKIWGINGIILATIISFTLVYFYGSSITFTKYFKNKKLLIFYFDNIVYMIVPFSIGFILYYIFSYIDNNMNIYIDFLVRSLVCLIIPNVVLIIIYLFFKEKREYIFELYNFVINKIGGNKK